MRIALAGVFCLPALLLAAPAAKPTFYKDVLPILQNRCQECHRAGEIAPTSFVTFNETRPWAKAIREAVLSKKMPPWFADPAHGKWKNDRSLSQQEIETLVAWVDSGAAEGSAEEGPPPKQWTTGWGINKPDAVFEMPNAFDVPAKAKVDYQYVVVPTNFTEDKWVQMVEARPSARTVVHHAVVFIREPGNPWLRGEAETGIPYVPPRQTAEGKPREDIGGLGSDILTVYTPGNLPDMFKPGQAKLIKAGSDLVFQMHYTSSGKAASDKTSVGIVFAKELPKERVITISPTNSRFVIPPGDPNYRVPLQYKFANEGTMLSFFPHMHLRGKAFDYKFKPTGGAEEILLRVPNYNFNWQLTYRLESPVRVKPGDVVEIAGYFDNSANNPYNPDPKSEVRWGEQSWEEMVVGFIDLAVSPDLDRRSFNRPARKSD
jgi:hypothetical protein